MAIWLYLGLGAAALMFAPKASASVTPKPATLRPSQTTAKVAPPSTTVALAKLSGDGKPIKTTTGAPISGGFVASSGVGNLRPLLDLIGRVEANGSYDAFYSGSPIRPPKPISQMTVAELRAFQDAAIARGSRSSAAGKYQIIKRTLATLPATSNEIFSPAKQDALAVALLQRRGLNQYRAGTMSEDAFMRALSQEWASLPKDDGGRSYYHGDAVGNRALVSPAALRAAIRSAR